MPLKTFTYLYATLGAQGLILIYLVSRSEMIHWFIQTSIPCKSLYSIYIFHIQLNSALPNFAFAF